MTTEKPSNPPSTIHKLQPLPHNLYKYSFYIWAQDFKFCLFFFFFFGLSLLRNYINTPLSALPSFRRGMFMLFWFSVVMYGPLFLLRSSTGLQFHPHANFSCHSLHLGGNWQWEFGKLSNSEDSKLSVPSPNMVTMSFPSN